MKKWISALSLLAAVSLCSQTLPRLQSPLAGEGGASFQLWKAGEDQATELAFPFSVIVPVHSRLQFWSQTAPVFSSLSAGNSYSLGGMSDILVGGHLLTPGGHLLITVGMNLPAGRTGLTPEETEVAAVLSQPALDFHVPELGQGFDLHTGLNTAFQIGSWTAGLGVSYLLKGGFAPFAGYDGSYDPGDEWSFIAGLERETLISGLPLSFTGDILYTIYQRDLWMDSPVFRSGARLLVQVQGILKMKGADLLLRICDRWKAENETFSEAVVTTARLNTNGNQFETEAAALKPVNQRLRLSGRLSYRIYANNDYGTGGAALFGISGGSIFSLSDLLSLKINAGIEFGRLNTSGGSVNAFGLILAGGFRVIL